MDRYAAVQAAAAPNYFGAWQVWAEVNTSNPCHIGGPAAERAWMYSTDRHTGCCGEDVLSEWLTRQLGQFKYAATVPLADVGLVRRLNITHAGVEAEQSQWNVEGVHVSDVIEEGRRRLGSSPKACAAGRIGDQIRFADAPSL